jgi:uncharacterized protein YgbK (DUF1537 family)
MQVLLILADDLTGALDTGVQFAKRGIAVQVCLGGDVRGLSLGGEVLVINTGTRHCSPAAARSIVGGIVGRFPAVPYVYKKTDSTLRGHIGAELEAMVRARNLGVLPFIPAYPSLGRHTRGGRQYLDGVPIDDTAMAHDALNPVRRSFIPDIIAEESALPTRLMPRLIPGPAPKTGEGGASVRGGAGPEIRIYDAESNADLRGIAAALGEQGLLGTTAGCAGFAEALVERIPFAAGASGPGGGMGSGGAWGPGGILRSDARPVLIISGSRHPVSLAQVRAAVDAGIPALGVEGGKLLRPSWFAGEEAASLIARCGELLAAGGRCILGTRLSLGQGEDSGGEEGGPENSGAAGLLGKLLQPILALTGPLHLAIFGGDTLSGIMEILGCRLIRPLGEIQPGIVLARAEIPGSGLSIAAKSGAFGGPGIIRDLINFFSSNGRPFPPPARPPGP